MDATQEELDIMAIQWYNEQMLDRMQREEEYAE